VTAVTRRCACGLMVQSLSVLSSLGYILEQHLGYVMGTHYLRLDGSVSATLRSALKHWFHDLSEATHCS
jgi:hypothetical protein